MRHTILRIFTGLSLLLMLSGCSTSTDSENGRLRILLTDAPADYQAVTIHFSEISAHIDSAWINVLTAPTSVNLLDYGNGAVFLLASEEVDPGHYTQIRVKIDSAFVTVDGVVHELTVPGGAQTGLKFGPQFTINEGSTYSLVIDFDANKSVVKSGQTYKLQPRIRVIAEAESGSVSGKVTNPADAPLACAIQGSDTLTTSLVDVSSGDFMLAYLPEGQYTIVVEDTEGLVFGVQNISVNAGEDNDLGAITLH